MAHKILGLRGILESIDTPTPSFLDDKTGFKKYNDFLDVVYIYLT